MLELSRGAANAVGVCMGVRRDEKVLVITDDSRDHIGHAIAEECELKEARATVLKIEDFVKRPALALPDLLLERVDEINPDVSFYVAAAEEGELGPFRRPLMNHLIYDLKARHGHMVNIDDRCMAEGMSADYEEIARLTAKVNEVVREARVIEAQAPSGTDIRATLDPSRLRWHPCPGIYHRVGEWGNLPEGETFTSPASRTATGPASSRSGPTSPSRSSPATCSRMRRSRGSTSPSDIPTPRRRGPTGTAPAIATWSRRARPSRSTVST